MWRVVITADFDDEASAEAAASEMMDVAGRHNGNLWDDEITNLDADES